MAKRRRAAGEGVIRQRPDGRWEGRLSLGWKDGKRVQRNFYAATQAEALDKLAKARADLKLGLPVEASARQTVGEFLDHWLEHSAKPRIKPRSFERFSEHIKLHIKPVLGNVQLDKLTPAHLERLMTLKRAQGYSAQTIVGMRDLFRTALNQALRWGVIARNVATLVDAPRIERRPVRVLAQDEVGRLLDAARGERLEAVFTVGIALGLRRGELLGLHWDSIDLDGAQLTIVRQLQRIRGAGLQLTDTKTRKGRRTIPLPQYAVKALRAHRARQLEERLAAGPEWQDNNLVFAGSTGGYANMTGLHMTFKRLLKKAGLPAVRFHDLRHSAASLMLAQGVPLKVIQEILGHSSIAVTSGFYAHLGEQLKRDAADAMDRVFERKGLADYCTGNDETKLKMTRKQIEELSKPHVRNDRG